MTIHVLSDYQISELGKYFTGENDISKVGLVCETGAVVIEYEYVGPFPTLTKGLQTTSIPRLD